MRGKAIKKSKVDRTAKIGSGSNVFLRIWGRYSYCGTDCELISCNIGNFCSISDHVFIGGATHSMEWVSMSPVFQKVKHPGPSKRFAHNLYNSTKRTIIGHDVWIGLGAIIKQGYVLGHGAVLGSGAVDTKDVPPYAIVGGVPAKIIKYRFVEDTIASLMDARWLEKKKKYARLIQSPDEFLCGINVFFTIRRGNDSLRRIAV